MMEKDRKLIIKKLVCTRRDFFVLKIFMYNSRDKSTQINENLNFSLKFLLKVKMVKSLPSIRFFYP